MSDVQTSSSSRQVMQTLAWTRAQKFKAVPLAYQSKAAITRHYVDLDYSTPADATWNSSNLGIGVVCGPQASGPVDIDLDCDEALFFAPRFLPKTLAVYGRASKLKSHLLYRVNVGELPKQAFLDPKDRNTIIEIRADGGHQSVLPGSVHPSGELVEWSSHLFPDVPSVDADELVKAVRKVAVATLIVRHLWIEGSRNEIVKHLAGMFYNLEWTLDDARSVVEAVTDYTGDDDRTRRLTVESTYRKAEAGAKVTGATTLRRELNDDRVVDRILEWSGSDTVNLINEYNEKYAVVNESGKCRIYPLTGELMAPMGKIDFFDFEAPDTMLVDGKRVSKAKKWFGDARRREYGSSDFMPGVADHPTIFNLWTGWGCTPDPAASCDAWLTLLRDVICGGDPDLNTWLLNWFANILRDPMKKAMTSLVVIGKQGAGKSLLFSYFGSILGRSGYIAVTNDEHIHGKFNNHFNRALLLHGDEALYAGDRKHRGIIKSMITDSTRIHERKGIDAKTVNNYLRLALTSNESHAAPVEVGDRRFTVIDMEDRKIPDEHIKAVVRELEGSGPSGLMDFLMNRFPYDPAVPRTNVKNEALATMQSIGLSSVDEWWLNTLQSGSVLPDWLMWATGPGKTFDPWPVEVSSVALYLAMTLSLRARHARDIPSDTGFGLKLTKYLGVRLRKGQRNYSNLCPDSAPPEARALSGRQSTILNLPTLTEARKAFTVYLGHGVQWDAPEPESDKPLHERF